LVKPLTLTFLGGIIVYVVIDLHKVTLKHVENVRQLLLSNPQARVFNFELHKYGRVIASWRILLDDERFDLKLDETFGGEFLCIQDYVSKDSNEAILIILDLIGQLRVKERKKSDILIRQLWLDYRQDLLEAFFQVELFDIDLETTTLNLLVVNKIVQVVLKNVHPRRYLLHQQLNLGIVSKVMSTLLSLFL
jgi:hypothetical protein